MSGKLALLVQGVDGQGVEGGCSNLGQHCFSRLRNDLTVIAFHTSGPKSHLLAPLLIALVIFPDWSYSLPVPTAHLSSSSPSFQVDISLKTLWEVAVMAWPTPLSWGLAPRWWPWHSHPWLPALKEPFKSLSQTQASSSPE